MNPEAFERFKEQMRRNAAHIAALKKAEKKQKKKEDRLHVLLMSFLKGDDRKYLMNLVSKLLAKNTPAAIVLSFISLIFAEAQDKLDVRYQLATNDEQQTTNKRAMEQVSNRQIAAFSDENLPLEVKVAIDLWFQAIHAACSAYPHRLDKSLKSLDEHGDLSLSIDVIQLCTFTMRDFLEEKGLSDITAKMLRDFVKNVLIKILTDIEKTVTKQKALEPGEQS